MISCATLAAGVDRSLPMHREINLSGGEIALLKTMGLSGAPVYGKLRRVSRKCFLRPRFARRTDSGRRRERGDVVDAAAEFAR